MTPRILGIGWVTAAGSDPDETMGRIRRGEPPAISTLGHPPSPREHRVALVPGEPPSELARHPRLRRASRISLLAADAGLRAIRDAGLEPETASLGERFALVFAVSSGPVIYSRRFFAQIVKGGAGDASPLLFPETVYNAPASHLAAILGADGICETLVGDGAAGFSALARARELLVSGQAERALVVGAEEVDWATCEGYARWRFRPLFAEGAAALLLGGGEGPALSAPAECGPSARGGDPAEAVERAARAASEGAPMCDLLVSGWNGTPLDRIESSGLARAGIAAGVIRPKTATGEPLGAGALLQAAAAALTVRSGAARSALVVAAGFRGRASAVAITG